MVERMEATKAPIEPFDGWVIDGLAILGARSGVAELGFAGSTVVPEKVMVRSSAIIAKSKPAQPGWVSMASGS